MKVDESDTLRTEISRASEAALGKGYPVPLRERVIAYARRATERGESQAQVAARLRLSLATLGLWLRGTRRPTTTTKTAGAFAAVKIGGAKCVVLVSPTGWRAEIDVETLAKLLSGGK
jgi:hypothetical protein